MRHRKRFNHLSRKSAHRKSMLANMASSLIIHKRIRTTHAKAKALRMYVEPLVNKAKLSLTTKTDKMDATHLRRNVFSYLKQKEAVTELFREVAPKVVNRYGGYTRIIKLGKRQGDNAEMAFVELVDFNELLLNDTSTPKKKTTRRRRRKKADGEKVDTAKQNVKETTEPVATEKKEIKETTSDDFKKIEGIGPKIAETLNNAGVKTFGDLSKMTPESISEIISDVRGKHVPDTWPKQAKMADEGKWDELKKLQEELKGGLEK